MWGLSTRQKSTVSATTTRGVSLVEVIVVSALSAIVFSGLFAGLQVMVNIISNSKAEAGARSLAVERMEYIRSLPYADVGTVLGIPAGSIPQTSTTSLNGIEYIERVLIQYLDRPEDGFAGADGNGITEDSKVVKVEYTWDQRGQTRTTTLISDLVPRGIESTAGGGTLLINVFDATVQPVVGASVQVFNNSIATATDVTVTTNANGIANFPGAPAGAGYEIKVTNPGYSRDQTYSATATNTSPNPPHVAVVEALVSTVNFAIDRLSNLTLRTISTPVTGVFSDSFANDSQVATSTEVVVSSGSLILDGGAGTYESSGQAFSSTTEPSTLDSWQAIDFNGTTTADTEFRVQLYSVIGVGSTSVYTLLPDTELAANSVGFIAGPVDITSIDASTYDRLALGVTLTSSSSSETPELYDWSLTHVESESPISGVTFDIAGSKNIGDNGGTPVLKYSTTETTNGAGEIVLTDLEWDSYNITLDGSVEGYDIKEAYAPLPYALSPNVSDELTLVMEPYSVRSLRTTVVDTLGAAIPGADVRLSNGAYDQTLETSIYGQAFFTGMPDASDYALDVSASGYDSNNQTNFAVSGTTETQVILIAAGSGGGGGGGTPSSTPTTTSTYLAGYDTRIPLSISGTSLFGSVSDFPVYVDLDDLPGSFFSEVQPTGADIRITTGDGLTEVPREIVSIDTGATAGQLHFRAPSLDTSTTSVFYLYYGSSTAPAYADSDTFGAQNVWSNNYLAVYHMEESVSGTGNTDAYRDATANAAHADDFVQDTDKSGIIGLGQRFEENTTDYMELPNTVLDGQTDVTLSFWYASNNSNRRAILSGARGYTTHAEANEYLLWFPDQNEIELLAQAQADRVNFNISNVNDFAWRHYAAVRDDTNNQVRLYINGAADNENPESLTMGALSITAGGLVFGADQDQGTTAPNDSWLDDDIDEIRISSIVRDAGWIANEHSNQSAPSLFYSVGSVETE